MVDNEAIYDICRRNLGIEVSTRDTHETSQSGCLAPIVHQPEPFDSPNSFLNHGLATVRRRSECRSHRVSGDRQIPNYNVATEF